MLQQKHLRLAFCLLLAITSGPAFGTAAVDAVQQAVSRLIHAEAAKSGEFKGADLAVELQTPQAQLPSCSRPEAFFPHQGQKLRPGRISVGLRCPGEIERYIQARLIVKADYLELSRDLLPGDTLAADGLRVRRGDLGELPRDVLRTSQEAVGKQAVRRLEKGTVLRSSHLRSIPLVERGQKVAVESRGRGFVARREGVAMESGGAGDRIRVRMSRREILEALVDDTGRLVVQP